MNEREILRQTREKMLMEWLIGHKTKHVRFLLSLFRRFFSFIARCAFNSRRSPLPSLCRQEKSLSSTFTDLTGVTQSMVIWNARALSVYTSPFPFPLILVFVLPFFAESWIVIALTHAKSDSIQTTSLMWTFRRISTMDDGLFVLEILRFFCYFFLSSSNSFFTFFFSCCVAFICFAVLENERNASIVANVIRAWHRWRLAIESNAGIHFSLPPIRVTLTHSRTRARNYIEFTHVECAITFVIWQRRNSMISCVTSLRSWFC